jgi:hypothetical protein
MQRQTTKGNSFDTEYNWDGLKSKTRLFSNENNRCMVFVFGVSVKEGNNDQRKNKGLGDGGEI